MKKWLYARRKQIFALLVGLVLVTTFTTSICAYTNPTATSVPDYPIWDDPQFSGVSRSITPFDITVTRNIEHAQNFRFPAMTIALGYTNGRVYNSMNSDSLRVTDEPSIVDRTYGSTVYPFLKQTITIAPTFEYQNYITTITSTAPFCFAPYTDSRSIAEVVIYEDLETLPESLVVSGKFRFLGNNTVHSFELDIPLDNLRRVRVYHNDIYMAVFGIEPRDIPPMIFEAFAIDGITHYADGNPLNFDITFACPTDAEVLYSQRDAQAVYVNTSNTSGNDINFDWFMAGVSAVLSVDILGNGWNLGVLLTLVIVVNGTLAVFAIMSHVKA